MEPYGIHWFRRDLRVTGNPALHWSWKKHSGRVVGIFFFDKAFLSRLDFSANRFQFFLNTLEKLREELIDLGSDLLFLDVGPCESLPILLRELAGRGTQQPASVSWNRDYEPFAKLRDGRMERLLNEKGIGFHSERDHLLIEPWELYKGKVPSMGYQVFTPFSKKWLELFRTTEVQRRIENQVCALRNQAHRGASKGFNLTWKDLGIQDQGLLKAYQESNSKNVTVSLPKAGSPEALRGVSGFAKRLSRYATQREIPGISGTSGLSVYLKNGSLTTAQVVSILNLNSEKIRSQRGPQKFLHEIIWREFFYHILWRHPQNETQPFQKRFEKIRWENRDDWFEAWKEGRTGYPIVDAGMRQLKQTGWMHNRVRMIVASFLTKDLLIDWRWGERYFMEKLLDGDLASNNGGWQWAASVGSDPQPYFRIFSPVLQSRRFDPSGTYIKRYVPELSHLESKKIHEPSDADRREYPRPIVIHPERRLIALAEFQSAENKWQKSRIVRPGEAKNS